MPTSAGVFCVVVRTIAVVVVGALAGCAESSRRLESAAVTSFAAHPTVVTLRSDSIRPWEALDEIGGQAGVTFVPADDSDPIWLEPAMTPPVRVNLVARPFWDAVRGVAGPAGVEPTDEVIWHRGTSTYYLGVGKSPRSTRPRTVFLRRTPHGEPPLAVCTSRGFRITAKLSAVTSSEWAVAVDLFPYADPNVPTVYWEVRSVEEVTDGAGHALRPELDLSDAWTSLWMLTDSPLPRTRDSDRATVPIVTAPDATLPGARLARLRGMGHAAVALRSETLDVSGLDKDPGRLSHRVWHPGGLRIEIKGLKRHPKYGTYELTATAVREGQSLAEWKRLCRLFRAALPAFADADGRGFDVSGGVAAYGPDDRTYQITTDVGRSAPRAPPGVVVPGDPPPGVPARIVWDFPTKVRYVDVPFDFSDVPMSDPPPPDESDLAVTD